MSRVQGIPRTTYFGRRRRRRPTGHGPAPLVEVTWNDIMHDLDPSWATVQLDEGPHKGDSK